MRSLYHSTRAALEAQLTCSLIASEVDFRSGVLSTLDDNEQILEYARANQFTRVLLSDLSIQSKDKERQVTHVAIINMDGGCVVEKRPIKIEDLLSGSTPINRLPDLLSKREFFLVFEVDRIRRILTRSDLNKLPMRVYLHTLLDHVEALMADVIEREYPFGRWLRFLSDQRRVSELHAKKKKAGTDTRLIDCTSLTNKIRILQQNDALRNRLEYVSGKTYRTTKRRITHVRNKVSHAGEIIVTKSDIRSLGADLETLEGWIEVLSATPEARA